MATNLNQFTNIKVPYNKLLARLGYAHGKTKLDDKTSRMITKESELGLKLINPKQVIASSKILFKASGIISLEPDFVIESRKIHELLTECSTAIGFAVTIGPNLEEKRNQYIADKETTRAMILDAVGSVIAEELADITNKQINEEYKKNKKTRRFSPGYGDWNIASQKDFLVWLGAEHIGIKLTQNYQMIPEKSVSAIMGISKTR